MADKYFAKVQEDLSKSWQYFVLDNEDLDDLKGEIEMMQADGGLSKNASITYYEANII